MYDELAPGERSALHRRAAALLADDGAGTKVSYEIDAALTGKLG